MRFTPELELQTLFNLSPDRRIISTREPSPSRGPLFALIRDHTQRAWAVGLEVEHAVAEELNALAKGERPIYDLRENPQSANRYARILAGEIQSGPAFTFPEKVSPPRNVATVENVEQLRYFAGWTKDELSERSPIVAVFEAGAAVSVCFCARRSQFAAEAGVETALPYRRRGFAGIVVTAWAASIQRSGLIPIYSTSWENAASLALARKLDLAACAQMWSVVATKRTFPVRLVSQVDAPMQTQRSPDPECSSEITFAPAILPDHFHA